MHSTEFVVRYETLGPSDPFYDYLFRNTLCNLHSFTRAISINEPSGDPSFTHVFECDPGTIMIDPQALDLIPNKSVAYLQGTARWTPVAPHTHALSLTRTKFGEGLYQVDLHNPYDRARLRTAFGMPSAKVNTPMPEHVAKYIRMMQALTGRLHTDVIFPFNTDSIPSDIPPHVNNFLGVCSGLKLETMIALSGSRSPRVTYTDCSGPAVEWRKKTLMDWDGQDYLEWCERTAGPNYAFRDTPFAFHGSIQHIDAFERAKIEWIEWWNWYRKNAEVHYEVVDYVGETERFVSLVRQPSLVWVTNAYWCQSTLLKYGVDRCEQAWMRLWSECLNTNSVLYSNALRRIHQPRESFDVRHELFELAGSIGMGPERP